MLRFPESDLSDVVYLEQLTSALYLDKREEVAQYDQVLRQAAEGQPGPSRDAEIFCGNPPTRPEMQVR